MGPSRSARYVPPSLRGSVVTYTSGVADMRVLFWYLRHVWHFSSGSQVHLMLSLRLLQSELVATAGASHVSWDRFLSSHLVGQVPQWQPGGIGSSVAT